MKKSHWVVTLVLVAAIMGGGAWYLMREKPQAVIADASQSGETIPADERHTMGDPKAKVVLIEYAAPICPTCAFVNATTIPELKRRYIDTGKVFYVFRIFPIDPADYKAGALAMCVPKEKYFDAIDMLYRRQEEWGAEQMMEHGPDFTMDKQPKTDAGLIKMGRALGMDAEKAHACMYDKAAHQVIDDISRQGGVRYGIGGTPTFIINGQNFPAVPRSVDDLATMIDPLLEGK